MKERELPKLISSTSAMLLLAGSVFVAGLYSGASQNRVFRVIDETRAKVTLTAAQLWTGDPINHLGPARSPGSGVTVNKRAADGSLVLLSGFFEGSNELRLIRRDGTAVARWPVRLSEHFPEASPLPFVPASELNIDTHGALIRPDGSVVFNYEYLATVKLSRCGEMIWRLPRGGHHSVEAAERGGYWIPGRNRIADPARDRFEPFTRQPGPEPYDEDLILRVAEDGSVVEEKSVTRILYESGLEPLLTATGKRMSWHDLWPNELVHVNKIAELPSAIADQFPGFESGDLMISMRRRNLIVVVDPDTWRVKWYQMGRWRRQHDPEFSPDGTVMVFNNNVYKSGDVAHDLHGRPPARRRGASTGLSNIIRMDPATRKWEVAYGDQPGQEFLTVIRGKHEITPEGGFLITEFEAGRVFEVDAEGKVVWEYVNRYDDERALEITEARIYPASYFEIGDWSCPK